MANLKDNNYHNLKIRVNKDEYWDFFINKDAYGSYNFNSDSMYDDCLISYIDASLSECISGDTWLYSVDKYQWESAYTTNNVMNNIGYTGVDNGFIRFRKDRVSNKEFVEIYKNSKYEIEEGDNRLKLKSVSGSTLLYDYPLHVNDGIITFNGGFYQGFFKTECDKYQVLPSKMGDYDTWGFEFVLNKCDMEREAKKTLNDKYPDNKGIFFYLGTRAENKWIYLYDKDDEYGYEISKQYDDEDDDFPPISSDTASQTTDDGEYTTGSGGTIGCIIDEEDWGNEVAEFLEEDELLASLTDPEPDFVDDDIDDYVVFNYYDEKYYAPSEEDLMDDYVECDGHSIMDDYLDYKIKAKLIDESIPHKKIKGNCCGKDGEVNCYDIFGVDYLDDIDDMPDDESYVEPEIDIDYFEYETDNGFKLSLPNQYYFYTDNKFMMFDRTCKGFTVKDWVEGTQMMYFGRRNKFKGNLFILMNRTCTGYTINNIDKLRDEENQRYDDLYNDIYNNAFALRIKDDGSIGYRYLVLDCESTTPGKYSILEGYSYPGVIKECEWQTVYVKIKSAFNKIKIYFYVDGKLVYVTRNLPMFNFHELKDLYEKQQGVPYNISIGGGTQGLAETVQFKYMLNPTRAYPIEKNFAGTFIGYMKSFKFYDCSMEYGRIKANDIYEKKKMLKVEN